MASPVFGVPTVPEVLFKVPAPPIEPVTLIAPAPAVLRVPPTVTLVALTVLLAAAATPPVWPGATFTLVNVVAPVPLLANVPLLRLAVPPFRVPAPVLFSVPDTFRVVAARVLPV